MNLDIEITLGRLAKISSLLEESFGGNQRKMHFMTH